MELQPSLFFSLFELNKKKNKYPSHTKTASVKLYLKSEKKDKVTRRKLKTRDLFSHYLSKFSQKVSIHPLLFIFIPAKNFTTPNLSTIKVVELENNDHSLLLLNTRKKKPYRKSLEFPENYFENKRDNFRSWKINESTCPVRRGN